ncbi:MAG: DUF5009 domain-containing protein [Cyclobacteriaceae bacterium]
MIPAHPHSSRILSIDAFRGFDMLLIIFADRFFASLHRGADTAFTGFLARQFEHPEWFGSTFYDIIMPLFLFVVGAVIPFSLSQHMQHQSSKGQLYSRLIKRFVILFILGWIVQGNLLALDAGQFKVFSNTLQAIAVGYVFSCLAFIHLSRNGRYLLFAACLVAYVLSHVIDFPAIANDLLFGLEQYSESWYPVWTSIGGFALLYTLLWYLYVNKTFIKV